MRTFILIVFLALANEVNAYQDQPNNPPLAPLPSTFPNAAPTVPYGTQSLPIGTAPQVVQTPFVSKTFQDILSRVKNRDNESKAILIVNLKEDASAAGGIAQFSIETYRGAPELEVVVTLFSHALIGDKIYEKYTLKIDEAMREELKNQKKLKDLAPERAKKALEERKEQIIKFSDGKLKYEMTRDEVIKIKGKPERVDHHMAAGGLTLNYLDMDLDFMNDRLQNVRPFKKPDEPRVAPMVTPSSGYLPTGPAGPFTPPPPSDRPPGPPPADGPVTPADPADTPPVV